MDPLLLSLPAAFGLAAASGLNASLPLLLVSLTARMGLVHLGHPYDALGSDVAFYGLLVIATCEFLVDKVPALDSVAHIVATPLAATSGAIVFASQTGAVDRVDPGLQVLLSLGLGATTATAVHVARAAARPVLNLGLLGPVASLLEDAVAGTLVLTALLAAALLPVVVGLVALLVVGLRRRRRRAREEELQRAAYVGWAAAWRQWQAGASGPAAGAGDLIE
ncbi:MAG: DUF4126 domain-containing protein [Candidatus Dormibacteraeota bacterium]|nr:DUF4126 domain-containing protein [Candidatus Dormibacteraeota bacterium]